MRPSLRLLDDALAGRILDEARDVLAKVGVEVHNDAATQMLLAAGASCDTRGRVLVPAPLVDAALRTAPRAVCLFDALGRQTHELSGDAVYFTPGSAAIHVLDGATGRIRRPVDRRLRPLREGGGGAAAHRRAVDRARPGGRRRGCRRQLAALPEPAPGREAGRHRRLQRAGLRGDAGPAARRPRHRGRAAGAAAVRLLVLPDGAAQVELRDEPERDRLRPRGRAGRVRLDAARRLRGPGHARRQRRPARGGDPLRRRRSRSSLRPARRSSGAARPPSSTCATRRRRWGRSRR